jgi:hypothetical protein
MFPQSLLKCSCILLAANQLKHSSDGVTSRVKVIRNTEERMEQVSVR